MVAREPAPLRRIDLDRLGPFRSFDADRMPALMSDDRSGQGKGRDNKNSRDPAHALNP
jgi:hypothetical protein